MNSEQLAAAARTVEQLGQYLEDLKQQSLAMFDAEAVSALGYITPSAEMAVRQLQLSYWKTRNALLELVYDIWGDVERFERATPQQFLVALAAASLLVDAARFLRETFHRVTVVRRKLDEPDVVYGVPPRMYDDVQKSLTSPYHAWYLWQAMRHYDRHRDEFRRSATTHGLEPMVETIERLRDRLRPPLRVYIRARLRVRGRRTVRRIGHDVLGRGIYALQEALGRGLAHLSTHPHHVPSLPRAVRSEIVSLLRPGDVLVVRKEFAATNYFLPGYWPHVALYLGTADDLTSLGLAADEHVARRLTTLNSATPFTAVLHPHEENLWTGAVPHPCVIEAQKDGVRIRSVNSPFDSDSIVVLRPLLCPASIAQALAHAVIHEGKPYDFDFDFCQSQRLVCTEVVYRAFEGIEGVQFNLQRHAGRFALAACELLRMGLARQYFEVLAVYLPKQSSSVETGPAAATLVRQIEGLPQP